MSTFLAVGAVSAVLRGLIEASVVKHDLTAVFGALPEVSALPPDRIATGAGTPDRINLFLFQATENAAWRNMDFPSRNGRGERLTNPKLALDLHYLVTAYGSADFRAEALLGHAMFVFHEMPVLDRQAIGDALDALPPNEFSQALIESRLADQFEQIKIVPRVLNVEEVSKIWTALQSQYRPTAAYHVSVVLVEADQPARSALPVLTRGEAVPGGDEGVFVHAGILPPVPTLESLSFPANAPAIRVGETLSLRGHHLGGTTPQVRFRLVRGTDVVELTPAAANESNWDVLLPDVPPPDWQVGIYEVTALMVQDGTERETNRLPLVLAPRLDSITPNLVAGELVSLEVTCSPPVRPNQTVVLLVGGREVLPDLPDPFNVPISALSFPAPGPPNTLPGGQQWVRLRVDGIESLLVDYLATPPQFQPSQSVLLP